MKNLTTKIENEIKRLETILEKEAWIDERWENEISGRITSLEWVLDQMTDTDEEDSNIIGGVDFSDSLDMLNNL
jgi:uncharacterized coiled-coil DUF342 family protein